MLMRAGMAGVLAALIAMPAAAQVNSTYGPINCVYDRLSPVQRGRLDLENIDSDANSRIMDSAFESCGARHKWEGALYLVAITHLFARLRFERAEAAIVKAGGRKGDLDAAYRAMTEEERAEAEHSDADAAAALARRAPNLVRFGPHAVNGVTGLVEMKKMEAAWASVAPDG